MTALRSSSKLPSSFWQGREMLTWYRLTYLDWVSLSVPEPHPWMLFLTEETIGEICPSAIPFCGESVPVVVVAGFPSCSQLSVAAQ